MPSVENPSDSLNLLSVKPQAPSIVTEGPAEPEDAWEVNRLAREKDVAADEDPEGDGAEFALLLRRPRMILPIE